MTVKSLSYFKDLYGTLSVFIRRKVTGGMKAMASKVRAASNLLITWVMQPSISRLSPLSSDSSLRVF